ncbi:conjugal transfer protein TraO [uncultured Chitinophaga sp.]|uniref:conjugal transfer protein TraO n=1 Tax=uncultured Chitinophaga sp. TaxID=339340 RepID=UPI00263A3BE7|nr:conjugal transfer protein TraO [uncultured Chitinophaga sp.]
MQLLGDAGKSVTFNAAFTLTGGHETINRGDELLYDGAIIKNQEGFVYGAGGRLSLETYLCDRIVLLVQGRTRVLWGTSTDQLRPSAGLGLRFNF